MRKIIKRDGRIEALDISKIRAAVQAALDAVEVEYSITDLVEYVAAALDGRDEVHVEEVQDLVECALISANLPDAAKAFILYRERRSKLRDVICDSKAIADYTFHAKYSRWDANKNRRETWGETCNRVEEMHIKKFPNLKAEITEAFDAVECKKILPSMRSMQFAGPAISKSNVKMFNCSFSLADRLRFFPELFWLLLNGCGCGYSIQRRHVAHLPRIGEVNRRFVHHHKVDDTIEGWAEALRILCESRFETGEFFGTYVEFDYSVIRPMGAELSTTGGRAPGHVGLKEALEHVRGVFDRTTKLRPIQVHEICCVISGAVLAGGVRRSSMIAIFSPEDHEMMECKTGDWSDYLAYANNSIAMMRGYEDPVTFSEMFRMAREFGEPGFINLSDHDYGVNPCGEIGLNPISIWTGETGWAFCNLVEINCATVSDDADFLERCKLASRIATLQASYTKLHYLTDTSLSIAEEEALIGVSLTGIVDCRENLDYRAGAAVVIKENRKVSRLIGINEAARTTCIKPSGTASLVLGGVGSGIHAHHSRRYFRRIIAMGTEPAFEVFKEANPHMCNLIDTKQDKWIVTFPLETDGLTLDDETAADLMARAMKLREEWVLSGTARPKSSPGLTNNVSTTVTVKDDEWDGVAQIAWEERSRLSAMTFISKISDTAYVNAPRQAVRTEADEVEWARLVRDYREPDYSLIKADGDPMATGVCEGMKCEL